MATITTTYLKEKLKLFLGDAEIEDVYNKIIISKGLIKKDSYSDQELDKIIEAMIEQGGFVEFVARNIKTNLLLGK